MTILDKALDEVEAQQAIVKAAQDYMRCHATYGCGLERMVLGEAVEAYATLIGEQRLEFHSEALAEALALSRKACRP